MEANRKMIKKPTLAIAKKLFERRNPGVKFTAAWKVKPMWERGQYFSRVKFEAAGYKPKVMNFYSDQDGIAIF